MQADIGLVGLAVMGENLVMNMESKGFSVAVYNRTLQRVRDFVGGRAAGKNIIGANSLEELVSALKPPRRVMLMVKAGKPVDDFIDKLVPLLDVGDIIIDGGNSNYHDTMRRVSFVETKGLLYIGVGVSGGEEGALKGPSMMPGGSFEAWEHVKPIFQTICAHVDGSPCCEWVGAGGAGHFVKMVHNGIEYGDMQLICEAYSIMKNILRMGAYEISGIFDGWNKGELNSYLIEITRDILKYEDENGLPLIDSILDTAEQKGTGKWTVDTALDEGEPLTLIGEAVFARCLSAMKDTRLKGSTLFEPIVSDMEIDKGEFINHLEKALYAAKIVSYAQGYALMRAVAKKYGWRLNYGEIALMWRGGCIIRSAFLGKIKDAFDADPDLENLLFAPYFVKKINTAQTGLRTVCSTAITKGVSIPALSAAASYFDGLRSATLPANLLQAQRDYFGAHTYERADRLRGEYFHTDWTGRGGATASTTYTA
ncbi:MAG: decarboxylating NADP(+)-dependent phosphogluconate dehydrogenase [Clostridiales bacterium]|jgi:6-phosphogluconate dehydrogenase|nr:decarboxylating NADP(+)-dependent phosphogluconate dehydrogenase [Clostridiales bacterium]